MPCSSVPLDIELIDSAECLKTSLTKLNKNFDALESYLISLSTCCSIIPCVSCTEATPDNPPPPPPPDGPTTCGIPLQFEDGGISYPAILTFELGAATGNVSVYFNALARPDRFILEIGGSVLLDTGYYGASQYAFGQWDRANFTNRLNGLIDPITGNVYPFTHTNHDTDGYPIVNTARSGTLSFVKTTTTSTCILCAFAPMVSTKWDINVGCPT